MKKINPTGFLRFFSPKRPRAFVDKKSKPFPKDFNKKIDIILSPSFYWARVEKLPVKYEYQAKSLLPSLFDGIIPEGEYNYEAIKKANGEFLVLAYNSKEIIHTLEELGLKLSKVRDVYFAQECFDDMDIPLEIDDKNALIKQGALLTIIPKELVENTESLKERLKTFSLPTHKIRLSRFDKVIDEKGLNKILYLLLGFIALYLVQLLIYKQEYNALDEKQREVIAKYNLPPTSLQQDAIIKNLSVIEDSQTNIRKVLIALFDVRLSSQEYFKKISLKGDRIEFEIFLLNPKKAELVKSVLQKRIDFTSIVVEENSLKAAAKI